jgi:predicted nucleic acid-binding Zn finger protein
MSANAPSAEDLAAVARLLGLPAEAPTTITEWKMLGSSGKHYVITNRINTKHGGTYLHCTCPGWAFQFNKGRDCKHVAEIRYDLSRKETADQYPGTCVECLGVVRDINDLSAHAVRHQVGTGALLRRA